jgi:hypothetical protein
VPHDPTNVLPTTSISASSSLPGGALSTVDDEAIERLGLYVEDKA